MNKPFKVVFQLSGLELDIPADRSILDVAEENGIDIPSSCREGTCGTCLTPVLEGTPDHRDFVLSESERNDNDMMTICCSRALSDSLVLDL